MPDELPALTGFREHVRRATELLERVRSGVADITQSSRDLDEQLTALSQLAAALGEQAENALIMGREDLAREARARQEKARSQLAGLKLQRDQLRAEEARLIAAEAELAERVKALQARADIRSRAEELGFDTSRWSNLGILKEEDILLRGAAGERNTRVIPQDVKIAVAVRDQGRCVECGSNEDLHYDHKIPWSRGGTNTINNIQLLCGTCNRRKGADDIPM